MSPPHTHFAKKTQEIIRQENLENPFCSQSSPSLSLGSSLARLGSLSTSMLCINTCHIPHQRVINTLLTLSVFICWLTSSA